MNDLRGLTAILTGASGGLGRHIGPALARAGMNVVLVTLPPVAVEELCAAVEREGVQALALRLDLRDPDQRRQIVASTLERFGSADLLVNNAAVEYSYPFHELSEESIRKVLTVNLEAPMMLAHAVLPEMLRRGRGHIVNISSLAGKSGPAYQEPYAATKAALTAFTYSLRGTYRGTGVSASVVCPGFIETGIYSRIKAKIGRPAPWLLGACQPEAVVAALVRAVRKDQPEVFVNKHPIRPLLALSALFPAFGAWVTAWSGTHEFFRQVAEAEKRRNGGVGDPITQTRGR